jgi:ketosteroid isomerase-like protein
MSERDVEVVRSALERYLATGEPAWEMTHADIEVRDHDIMDAGEYRGHAGFRRWLEDWAGPWSEFNLEPQEYLDAGQEVVAILRMTATGRASGVTVEREDAMVFRVEGGQIVRLDYYNNPSQALGQVGLER